MLDFLRVKQVVGLGDGAGANIITRQTRNVSKNYKCGLFDRFGMNHPSRVHGVFTINNRCGVSLGRFMEGLKVNNSKESNSEEKWFREK